MNIRNPKTIDEINEEIKRLKAMAPKIRQYNAFGESNRDKINAQIEALEEGMDDEAIDGKEEDGDWGDNEVTDARYAVAWAEGFEKIAPSDDWKPLIGK